MAKHRSHIIEFKRQIAQEFTNLLRAIRSRAPAKRLARYLRSGRIRIYRGPDRLRPYGRWEYAGPHLVKDNLIMRPRTSNQWRVVL